MTTRLAVLLLLATCLLPYSNCVAQNSVDGYSEWSYSGSFYISTTPDGADLSANVAEFNFPVLLKLTSDFFSFDQAKNQGQDIRFATPSGLSLSYEIEVWDAEVEFACIWIRIPVIKGNEVQEIKMYWGNPKAKSQSHGAMVFNESNGFLSVWHMGKDIQDVVGTVVSDDLGSVQGSGVIGSSRHFSNGTYIHCGDSITAYPSGAEERTTSAWINANEPGWAVDWGMEARCQENSIKLSKPPVLKNEGYLCDVFGESILPYQTWHYAVITYKDGDLIAYVNGLEDGRSVRQFVTPDTSYMRIGQRHDTQDTPWGRQWWNGSIDEVRISKVARSADWIKMEYENQNSLSRMVGPLVQPGDTFTVSKSRIQITEGSAETITAKADGAQKIYWILKMNGQETLLAVDQLSYTFDPGRVTGDQKGSILFKAIYPRETKTLVISIDILENIPDPVFILEAPIDWDGRECIEVVPILSNLAKLQANGVDDLNVQWQISDVAVEKEILSDKLMLKRAHNSGLMHVNLRLDNGGMVCSQTIAIRVREPNDEIWVPAAPIGDKKPVDNQFYARDDQNRGTIFYNGQVSAAVDELVFRVYANEKLYYEEMQEPEIDGSYRFKASIEAGLIKYRVELWSKKRRKKLLIEKVSNIICGDVYLIQGQSNAEAYDYGKADNPFTSTWVRSFGSSSTDPLKSSKDIWGNAVSFDKDSSILQIGYWGIELSKILLEKYSIPVCILNGAKGGSRIDQHQRNIDNPEDEKTIYGRLLRRVREAGLSNGVRAVFWHQGENDQGAAGPDDAYGWENYQQYFVDMASAWKSDYPNIRQYYIFQIWPNACSMGKDGSGDRLREVQRTLPELFSNMSIMSTLGIRPGGGCHFPPEGYARIAELIAPLVERDFYDLEVEHPIQPANLVQAYYTSSSRDEICLEFDQEMKWNESLVSEFYLDGESGWVSKGALSGNRIFLNLKSHSDAKNISYLDGKNWNEDNILWGDNGIAALTFYEVQIEPDHASPSRLRRSLERSPIEQPYPYMSSGNFIGRPVPESPDPLVSYQWPRPNAMDGLEVFILKPTHADTDHPESFSNLSSLLTENPSVKVMGTGSIRLDFGTEMPAWIEFDSHDCPGGVEMSISENNQPVLNKTKEPEKIGSSYRLNLNDELYEGVRFAWIHVKSHSSDWHISDIRAMNQVKPTNYRGRFSCSDPLLTKIWYMSAYSVRASFCEDYFGAVLMDRGDRMSWTGDAHPIQAASLIAFGNYDFVKRNLDNSSTQDNGIRSYSLYWVLSLLDYYQYSGDQETLEYYIKNACKKLDEAYSVFGTDPHLRFYGWDERLTAGFELWFKEAPEAQKAYEMLSIRAWKEFAEAMYNIGQKDLADKYFRYANSKMKFVKDRDDWLINMSLHSSADAVNTELLSEEEQDLVYESFFMDRVNRLSISPFNQYFVIQAMAQMQQYDDALSSIRDHWGGMVKNGASTTYEVYRPQWNDLIAPNDPVPTSQSGLTSLCHPWGAGPVKWLNDEILGITPTKAGFETFDILPHPGRTLSWVSGSTPTPFGEIVASFNTASGKCFVSFAEGKAGRMGIPKAEMSIRQIEVNGELVWNGAFQKVQGISDAYEDDEFVYFLSVEPGVYNFNVNYTGKVPEYIEAPIHYDAEFVSVDSVTEGNWGGIYGKDGYVLCNYHGDRRDEISLSSSIDSIQYFRAFPRSPDNKPEPTVWAEITEDTRALAKTAENALSRTAAGYSNVQQTMTVSADVKGTKEFQIALYFVDWEKKGGSQTVEMFDARTLKMIAPVKMIDDYSKGKYLIYRYNKSVKFRINKVRGEEICLNGIFFDYD